MSITRRSRGGDQRPNCLPKRGAKDRGEYREVAGVSAEAMTRFDQIQVGLKRGNRLVSRILSFGPSHSAYFAFIGAQCRKRANARNRRKKEHSMSAVGTFRPPLPASQRAFTAKPPERSQNRRLCLSVPNNASVLGRETASSGLSNRRCMARMVNDESDASARAISSEQTDSSQSPTEMTREFPTTFTIFRPCCLLIAY